VAIDDSGAPIRDEAGTLIGVVLVFRDVTARRQVERRLARLQAATAAFAGALTPAHVAQGAVEQGVPALGADAGLVLRAGPEGAAEGVLEVLAHAGYAPGVLEGIAPIALMEDTPASEALRTGQPVFIATAADFAARYPTASYLTGLGYEARAALPIADGDNVLAVLILSFRRPQAFTPDDRDLALALARLCGQALVRAQLYLEARALAAELEQRVRARTAELQALIERFQSVREEERSRMAREIHDELGGALTGLKMDVAQIRRAVPQEADRALGRLEELSGALDHTVQTVRRIAGDLRPAVLDDFGLVAALEWQLDEFGRRSGLMCRFRTEVSAVELGREAATAVFRIFQEALTNISRHAEATQVDVHLEQGDGFLVLRVRDDGRGIAPEQAAAPHSLGLVGMRERARYLAGDIAITGAPGQGTTVLIKIPVR
jgi:signal transduction histidine kinase